MSVFLRRDDDWFRHLDDVSVEIKQASFNACPR